MDQSEQQQEEIERRAAEAVAGYDTLIANPFEYLKQKYSLITLTSETTLPPIKWHVHKLLPEKVLATFVALPKVGKSWLLLALAIATATGCGFLGRDVKITGPVLYFAAEAHFTQTVDRAKALLKRQGLALADLGERLHFIPVGANLEDETVRADLETIIDTLDPVLVIFDPLVRFLKKAEENSVKEMRPVVNWWVTLAKSRTVAIAHHTDKQGKSARGTGDFLGMVDVEFFLNGRPSSNRFIVEGTTRYAPVDDIAVRIEVKNATGTDEEGSEYEYPEEADLVVVGQEPAKPEEPQDIEKVMKVYRCAPWGLSMRQVAKETGFGFDKAKRVSLAAGAEVEDGKWFLRDIRNRMQQGLKEAFSDERA